MKRLKITYNAPVILTFVLISLVVLGIHYLTAGLLDGLLFTTYHTSLLSPLTYIRLFTHVLGHSGWEHYIGNMSLFLLLGPMLEEKYGSKRIITIIAITALITGLFNYIVFPDTALCGASGIVFAFILLTSFTNFKDGEIPLTFILIALIYLGEQIYMGVFIQDDISNTAHIVGGLVGAICGYHLNKTHKQP